MCTIIDTSKLTVHHLPSAQTLYPLSGESDGYRSSMVVNVSTPQVAGSNSKTSIGAVSRDPSSHAPRHSASHLWPPTHRMRPSFGLMRLRLLLCTWEQIIGLTVFLKNLAALYLRTNYRAYAFPQKPCRSVHGNKL
jgi:hypothetical protein